MSQTKNEQKLKTHTQINKHALIYAHTNTYPPGQGPMGVCTKIGHLSHMMSRGRGYIIDEPKQHVSVSTHCTARDMGGNSRRWAERAGNSSRRLYCDGKIRNKKITTGYVFVHKAKKIIWRRRIRARSAPSTTILCMYINSFRGYLILYSHVCT